MQIRRHVFLSVGLSNAFQFFIYEENHSIPVIMNKLWTIHLILSAIAHQAHSIVIGSSTRVYRTGTRRLQTVSSLTSSSSSSAIHMIHPASLGDQPDFTEMVTAFSKQFSISPPLMGGEAMSFGSSPFVEAQVLNDVSHLASDLAVYITPATAYLRLAALIGRILSMTSDYLPDHMILPEEFIFQHMMLFTTLGLLIKSIAPILQSSFVQTNEFDEDAYRMLFEPIGVSWTQYKSLKATSCIDWVTVDANTILVNEHEAQAFKPSLVLDNATFTSEIGNLLRDPRESEQSSSLNQTDSMYWLYRGHVSVSYDGKKYYEVTRTRGKYIDDPEALGFLADMRFLYMIDRNRRRKRLMEIRHVDKMTKVRHVSHESHVSSTPQSWKVGYPMATITVKSNEAVLLRVHGSKLLEMMEDDEPLSNAVRLLLMMSLQRKIGALLRNGRDPSQNVYDLVSATDRLVFQQRSYKNDSSSPDYFS